MPTPGVSVILPTYNRRGRLPRAVNSVLYQSFRDFELIIVDDASTDDTQAYVESLDDPRVVYHRLDQNRGAAGARNAGIALARAPFVAFQDSDDEWLLSKLEMQMEAMQGQGVKVALNLCGIIRFDGHRVLSNRNTLLFGKEKISHEHILTAGAMVYTQTWMARREALQQAGGFDESMGIWDDWELLIRLSRDHDVTLIQQPLVISEKSPDSLSVVSPKWVSDLKHILAKHEEYLAGKRSSRSKLRYILARHLINEDRWEEARRELMAALRDKPGDTRAWVFLMLSAMPSLGARVLQARHGQEGKTLQAQKQR